MQPGSVRAKEEKVLILDMQPARYVFFHTGARAIRQGWAPSHGCLQGLQSCQITASGAQELIRPAVFIIALGCVSQATLPPSACSTFLSTSTMNLAVLLPAHTRLTLDQ